MRWSYLCGFLALTLLVGCGDPPLPTGTLSGTLKMDGELYTKGCNLNIIDPSTGVPAATEVNDQGAFTFPDSIRTGNYMAFISPLAPPEPTDGSPPLPVVFDSAIPEKYRNDLNTDLKITIEEGENKIDLDMKTK